jgi:hypothetical protein
LKESRYWPRLIWIGLIAAGVLGLKLVKEQAQTKILNCEPLHAFRAAIYGKHLIRNTLNTRFYKFK